MTVMMLMLLMTMLMMTMRMLMMQEGGNARLAVSLAPPRDSATLPQFGFLAHHHQHEEHDKDNEDDAGDDAGNIGDGDRGMLEKMIATALWLVSFADHDEEDGGGNDDDEGGNDDDDGGNDDDDGGVLGSGEGAPPADCAL